MKPLFWGYDSLMTEYVIYCSNLVCSIEIHEINMSSNARHVYFLRDTHGEKYNAILNSDP